MSSFAALRVIFSRRRIRLRRLCFLRACPLWVYFLAFELCRFLFVRDSGVRRVARGLQECETLLQEEDQESRKKLITETKNIGVCYLGEVWGCAAYANGSEEFLLERENPNLYEVEKQE